MQCGNREAFRRKKITGIVWFVAQQEGRVAHTNPTLVPIQVGGLVLGEIVICQIRKPQVQKLYFLPAKIISISSTSQFEIKQVRKFFRLARILWSCEKIIQKVILGANCAYIQLIFQSFDTLHEKKTNIVWFVAQQEGRVAHAIPVLVPIQVGGLDFLYSLILQILVGFFLLFL